MTDETIEIRCGDKPLVQCTSVVVVPDESLNESGLIRTMTTAASSQSKHEFHALAQIARSLHEDGELECDAVKGSLVVSWRSEVLTLADGLVIYRDSDSEIRVISNSEESVAKLLRTADRYCTRWVRLDI